MTGLDWPMTVIVLAVVVYGLTRSEEEDGPLR